MVQLASAVGFAHGISVAHQESEAGVQNEVGAYFTTNLEEKQGAPLTFDVLPPAWLKGTLVSPSTIFSPNQPYLHYVPFLCLCK